MQALSIPTPSDYPDLIRRRSSCRTYTGEPLSAAHHQALNALCAASRQGPLGGQMRFLLAAATAADQQALKGLGTYGFIRGAAGFIIGCITDPLGPRALEDFGYLMEQMVLQATGMGIGTCWLGGSFTRSSFALRIAARANEEMPAVVALGYSAAKRALMDQLVRQSAGSQHRLPWERLFFEERFDAPITPQAAGNYAEALEMVRLGPSASNQQPWRIVHCGPQWHFYLQRTPGYGKSLFKAARISDMQRIDIGIAQAHFALGAAARTLRGRWVIADPAMTPLPANTEYRITWMAEDM